MLVCPPSPAFDFSALFVSGLQTWPHQFGGMTRQFPPKESGWESCPLPCLCLTSPPPPDMSVWERVVCCGGALAWPHPLYSFRWFGSGFCSIARSRLGMHFQEQNHGVLSQYPAWLVSGLSESYTAQKVVIWISANIFLAYGNQVFAFCFSKRGVFPAPTYRCFLFLFHLLPFALCSLLLCIRMSIKDRLWGYGSRSFFWCFWCGVLSSWASPWFVFPLCTRVSCDLLPPPRHPPWFVTWLNRTALLPSQQQQCRTAL